MLPCYYSAGIKYQIGQSFVPSAKIPAIVSLLFWVLPSSISKNYGLKWQLTDNLRTKMFVHSQFRGKIPNTNFKPTDGQAPTNQENMT